MKKLATISLFVFWAVVTAVLVAGLVFYQNSKDSSNSVAGSKVDILTQTKIKELTTSGKSLVLNMSELAKHNKPSDCWMLISGKVYNITPFFGSHPGGNATMLATCGTDATAAYMTKDPNATSATSGSSHSSNAKSMLASYYLGDLNQTIGTSAVIKTNAVVAPTSGGENEYDD